MEVWNYLQNEHICRFFFHNFERFVFHLHGAWSIRISTSTSPPDIRTLALNSRKNSRLELHHSVRAGYHLTTQPFSQDPAAVLQYLHKFHPNQTFPKHLPYHSPWWCGSQPPLRLPSWTDKHRQPRHADDRGQLPQKEGCKSWISSILLLSIPAILQQQ